MSAWMQDILKEAISSDIGWHHGQHNSLLAHRPHEVAFIFSLGGDVGCHPVERNAGRRAGELCRFV